MGQGVRPGRGLGRPGGPRPFFCSGMRISIILWTKHRHTSVVTATVTRPLPKGAQQQIPMVPIIRHTDGINGQGVRVTPTLRQDRCFSSPKEVTAPNGNGNTGVRKNILPTFSEKSEKSY